MTFNQQISEEAAEWFVEFRLGHIDAGGRRAFDSWLRTSPEHLRAYLELAALWEEGSALNAHRGLNSDDLIALARTEGNVVSLDLVSPRPGQRRRLSTTRLAMLAAGLAIFVLGAAVMLLWHPGRDPVFATTAGERRILRLEDGSSVELNSRSRIQVRFSPQHREVELLEGQALFRVAKDSHRPFVVRSDELCVRAVGTQFDVNRKTAGTIVTVVEGRVAVRAHLLSAGDQLTVSDQTPRLQPQHASPAIATAWTQGQLVLDSETLADVAEEFSRYSTRRLSVQDLADHPLRLSGVFATDPDFLLRYLRKRPDITVEESATEIRIIHRDPK
jgi:transmembrane sensor